MPTTIHITYCPSWGFDGRFRGIRDYLEAELPGLTVIGQKTPNASGAFEIEDKAKGIVYFSKLKSGTFLQAHDHRSVKRLIERIVADNPELGKKPPPQT